MKIVTIFTALLALASVPLSGVSISFEIITPSSNERDYHPKVQLKAFSDVQYLLNVSKIRNHAWLIVCTEERDEDRKGFRQIIWNSAAGRPKDIELVVPLMVKEDGTLQIGISEDLASRSYVAIDFPGPVLDGGVYYTIDIPEFHRHLKGEVLTSQSWTIPVSPTENPKNP